MVPKKSIRKVASQPKAPALHSILLSKDRQDVDIYQYFTTKRSANSQAAPPPVLDGAVVAELQRVLRDKTERKIAVQIVTVCLDEFSTNSEVEEPWSSYYEEISQLLCGCLTFIVDIRKQDSLHKTSNFPEAVKVLTKLCHVLICLSSKPSVNLSTSIFNKCAESLLTLLLARDVKTSLQELILTALSSLCLKADQQKISATFKRVSLRLKYVAKMILDLSVDGQMSIYTILFKSVLSKDEADEKAHIWFNKWPTLRDSFIECCTKSYSQGCGIFLDKLYELRTISNMNHKSCSTRTALSYVKSLNSYCSSQNIAKNFGETTSNAAGVRKGSENTGTVQGISFNVQQETRTLFLKPSVDWRNSESLNSSKQNLVTARLQTSSHPNHLKSSLNGSGSTQSSVLKPPRDRDEFQTRNTHTIRMTTQNERPETNQQFYGSNLTQSKSHSAKAVREKFDISPKNRQFCPRRDSDITVSTHDPPEISKKNTFRAQSPLSELGEEDHCSKVERWFSGFSSVKDSTKLSGQKRSASTHSPSQSKKRKIEVPPTPISKGQSGKPAQLGVAGTGAIQYEMPSIKLNKITFARPEDKSSSNVRTNNTPGQKTGKRTLYSKSSKEFLECSFSLEEKQIQPHQEQISKANDPKPNHWKQKVEELDSCSKVRKSEIYNFGKTESENSFKIPSKAAPKKKTAKPPKVPPRFACFMNNKSYPKIKENVPPRDKLNHGAKKDLDCVSAKPSAETNNSKTSLKEISSHETNKRQINNANTIFSKKPAVAETTNVKTPLKEVTNHVANNRQNNNFTTIFSKKPDVAENTNMKTPKEVTNNRQNNNLTTSFSKKPVVAETTNMKNPLMEVSNNRENNNLTTTFSKKPIVAETTNVKTPLMEVTNNRPSNNSTNILSNKYTNAKNGSTASSIPQIGSESEEQDGHNTTRQYYSPIEDDSFEMEHSKRAHQVEKIVPQAHSHSSKHVKTENKKPSSPVLQPSPIQPPVEQVEHCEVIDYSLKSVVAETAKEVTNSRQINLVTISGNKITNLKNNSSAVSSPSEIGTKAVPNIYFSSAPKDSRQTPSTSRKNKSREWDSGIDTSDVYSTSSKEAKSGAVKNESARSQFLRMRLKDYLERAKDANSNMSANQNVVSTELVEIKGLVEKLTASVDRCRTASNLNEKSLRDQKTSLAGCSRYLDPEEDQSFPAKVSARKAVDYKEFVRQIRAKSAERIREMLQTVVDEDLPLSPPSSDSDE
ncbi:putative uncharacterized protein DDB_G0277255 [Thrips palmi]|uniref:Uncharacterized protein n=1 Tax=Thrips palmi TaxID=161013 RepID=A0A6P9AF33_THRPL|nr:putative uncharacterized protein DDB_G0277255 [Thrips palmi]